jgi:hypothetical protein
VLVWTGRRLISSRKDGSRHSDHNACVWTSRDAGNAPENKWNCDPAAPAK